MIRFWFQFIKDGHYSPCAELHFGCGVTALDEHDAINILNGTVFKEKPMPEIERVLENIDISKLDKDHVQPNLGNILKRGVWFPLEHEYIE